MTDAATGRRIERVQAILHERQLDGLLVLVEENRRYLSGFIGEDGGPDESSGALLIGPGHLFLATDSRFTEQAGNQAPGYEVITYRRGLADVLPDLLDRMQVRRLGFESRRLSVHDHGKLTEALQKEGSAAALVETQGLVERLRAVKSEDEIEATRRALALAEDAFAAVATGIRPGQTERELAWALEKAMREAGADAVSFPTICAAGANSALPHAVPGDDVVAAGQPLLFDWGARRNGYCSDTSRTVVPGKPGDRFLRVYETVHAALHKAVAAIRDGVSGTAVDAVARGHIEAAGFKDAFGHGLGHGTGLAVHEPPRLSPLKDETLEAGMIVTVEPGIYLPGWGGVRLENQVVVRPGGAEVLNRLPFQAVLT